MRLINADELMEHVWRDKLDSRELIAKMVENAPTVKEIPTRIPLEVWERLVSAGNSKEDTLVKIREEIEEYKSRQLSMGIGIEDLEKGKQIALEYVLSIVDKYIGELGMDAPAQPYKGENK